MNSAIKALNPTDTREMIITWNLGPRCNFDCVYCDPLTHDNNSSFASFDDLKKTTLFIKKYLDIILPYRIDKKYNISLTGGEPTFNPNFAELIPYLNENFQQNFNITTNGSFDDDVRFYIKKHMSKLTISYHCDSPPKIKQKVVDNIIWLRDNGIKFRVNLMFHFRVDYFNECIKLANFFDKENIKYVPRVVNHHPYTEEQSNWFKEYWQKQSDVKLEVNKTEGKKVHTHSKQQSKKVKQNPIEEQKHIDVIKGRHCCSNIDLNMMSNDNQWHVNKYCVDTNFKEWYCSVNWFFMHIDQHTGDVYHHQTCQHNFNKKREPIGNLKNSNKIIENLKDRLENKEYPIIKCTTDWCKCGMCTPKSNNIDTFKNIMKQHIVLDFSDEI